MKELKKCGCWLRPALGRNVGRERGRDKVAEWRGDLVVG
jgi:hypothetical protein